MRFEFTLVNQSGLQQSKVIPIVDSNAKVDVESPASRRPAENMAQHDFPGSGASEKVGRFMLAGNRIDLSNGIKNGWIDPVMPDF
jgi:hypothetical protein